MKKLLSLLLTLIFILGISACASDNPVPEITESDLVTPAVETRILALKGPTGIGMAKMMEDESADINSAYTFTVAAQPTEAVAAVSGAKVDIAAVPTNLASTLYKKTEKGIKIIAINTLGSLYILEKGDTIKSFADLRGKTLYATGQGANPEYVLSYLLEKNGLKVGTDVKVEFKTEHAELASLMAAGECVLGMLPEPNVSSAMAQNPELRIALNLNEEWNKVSGEDSRLTMGCVVVRNEFLEKHPEEVATFITKLEASIKYANEKAVDTGLLCEKYGIVPKAALAAKAIPNCNLTVIKGADMKKTIEGYFGVLHTANPASIGGAVPDEGFYYIP
ncbi:MAG: ABC transporter substrate-binding protein [Clostridia bacterium]|nr:ABC transporter substrate-binding protein [Clostridia bacterium]